MAVCICDGHHFSTTTISTYHKNISDNRVESYGHPNLRRHSISTFELNDILLAQWDIPVKTFACQDFPESSLVVSGFLNSFLALCRDPDERLWPFVFTMGLIFQQRRSQHIIKIYRTTESKVMAIRICVVIRIPLSSSMIYFGAQSDIRGQTFNCRNLLECSLLIFGCLNRFLTLRGDLEEMLWLFVFLIGFIS